MGADYDVVKYIRKEDDKLYVELFGTLSADTADRLTEKLDSNIDGVSILELNMEKLAYITSAGIRSLMKAAKQMRAQDGKVIVNHVNDDVMGVFELMNITSFLTIE